MARLTARHIQLVRATQPQRCGAEKAVAGNLLFDMLSKEARRAIFASMEPLVVSAGTQIITQVLRLAPAISRKGGLAQLQFALMPSAEIW